MKLNMGMVVETLTRHNLLVVKAARVYKAKKKWTPQEIDANLRTLKDNKLEHEALHVSGPWVTRKKGK